MTLMNNQMSNASSGLCNSVLIYMNLLSHILGYVSLITPDHLSPSRKVGHMEKQETEMKWKLEMETGNGNWKQKWEQKTHQSLVQS